MTHNLSFSQRFYLLQQKKGNMSSYFISTNSEMYMFGAVLVELRLKNIINIVDSNKVVLLNENKTGVKYLDSVINYLKKNNNYALYDLLYRYTYNQFDTAKKEIHESLLDETNSNLLDYVIEGLRAELLEPGEVSDVNKALILLLNTSNYDVQLSKKYFSEYEKNILAKKMKEIKSQPNELTKDIITICDKFEGGLVDLFSSLLPALSPQNLLQIRLKYIFLTFKLSLIWVLTIVCFFALVSLIIFIV